MIKFDNNYLERGQIFRLTKKPVLARKFISQSKNYLQPTCTLHQPPDVWLIRSAPPCTRCWFKVYLSIIACCAGESAQFLVPSPRSTDFCQRYSVESLFEDTLKIGFWACITVAASPLPLLPITAAHQQQKQV